MSKEEIDKEKIFDSLADGGKTTAELAKEFNTSHVKMIAILLAIPGIIQVSEHACLQSKWCLK